MTRLFRTFASGALGIAWIAQASTLPTPDAMPAITGVLEGTVIDSSSREKLAGITMHWYAALADKVVTDREGWFSIGSPPATVDAALIIHGGNKYYSKVLPVSAGKVQIELFRKGVAYSAEFTRAIALDYAKLRDYHFGPADQELRASWRNDLADLPLSNAGAATALIVNEERKRWELPAIDDRLRVRESGTKPAQASWRVPND